MGEVTTVILQIGGVPLWAVAGIAIGIVLFALGASRYRRAASLTDTGLDSTRDAIGGHDVLLEGEVRPADQTLTAPFSGTECLGFELEVQEWEEDHDDHDDHGTHHGGRWATKHSDRRVAPFLLSDDDGTVQVIPENIDIDIADDTFSTVVDGGETPPDQIQQFIESSDSVGSEDKSVDLKLFELDYGDKRRYRERRLELGETTFVGGLAASASEHGAVDEADAVVTGDDSGLLDGLFGGPPRMIRDESFEEVTGSIKQTAAFFALVGVVAIAVSVYFGVMG